ncbi:nucleotidyltransferase family protein [Candidatus Hodarchaeum mangrovi]
MIIGLILAAGESLRFKQNKLFAEIKPPKRVIDYLIDHSNRSNLDNIVFVLGYSPELIINEIKNFKSPKINFIINNEYKKGGMTSSIKTGFKFIINNYSDVDAVLITPADIPFITPNIWNKIIKIFYLNNQQTKIIIPTYMGKKGHPILLSKELFSSVQSLSEKSHGLKAIISRYWEEILFLEMSHPGILFDIDDPKDLELVKHNVHKFVDS